MVSLNDHSKLIPQLLLIQSYLKQGCLNEARYWNVKDGLVEMASYEVRRKKIFLWNGMCIPVGKCTWVTLVIIIICLFFLWSHLVIMGNHHGKEVRNIYSCHMAISPPVHTSEIMESLSFQIGRKGREKNLSTLPEYLLVLHVILATTGNRLP